MDTSANEYLKGAIEALLFISEKPVALEHIAEVMQEGVGAVDVRKLVEELREEYESKQRGMVIVEIAGGYQMLSSSHYVSFVRNFLKTKVKEKLSRPALEALAIVAYKQPVSRGDIELVRGVNSDGVALHLLDKGLIKIVGKKDGPGRPYLYGTSKLFLEYFGLKSLRDLPKLEDVSLLLADVAQNVVIPLEGDQGEQTSLLASQALDEAEALAVKESRTQQIEESIVEVEENFADVAFHERSVSQEPETLKEAMEDFSRDETKQETPSSLETIIAQESAAQAKTDLLDDSASPDFQRASVHEDLEKGQL